MDIGASYGVKTCAYGTDYTRRKDENARPKQERKVKVPSM